jgi:hypothetical protein
MSNDAWKQYTMTVPNPNKISGTALNKAIMDDVVAMKPADWMASFAPNGVDVDRYYRLRNMRVNRHAVWSIGCVDIIVTHIPTGTTSRTIRVSSEDSTAFEVIMAEVISILARELETEIAVYERLEEAK